MMLPPIATEFESAEPLRMQLWGQRLEGAGGAVTVHHRSPGGAWGAAGAQGGTGTAFSAARGWGRRTPWGGQPHVTNGVGIHAGQTNSQDDAAADPAEAGAAMNSPQSSPVPYPDRQPPQIVARETGARGPEDAHHHAPFDGAAPHDPGDRDLGDCGGDTLNPLDVLDAAEAVAQLSQLLTDMADSVAEFNRQFALEPEPCLDLADTAALPDDGVMLAGVNLDGAALAGCDLSGERMQGTSLVAANLTAAVLNRTNLETAILTGACLTRAVAIAATFEMAKLDEVQAQLFQGRGSNFNYAKLRRSRLDLGDFERGRFDFASLRSASAIEASFSAASMQYANLHRGRFIRADFRGADLRQADLTAADLRGARLDGADLTGANLTGAVLVGAKFSRNTLWPQGFSPIAAGAILEA